MEKRMTCLNCMDGRVQLPVLQWIKEHHGIEIVDVITEAGMDGVLARQKDISEILRSIKVPIDLNKSVGLFVVGHYDCRGNPTDDKTHRKDIADAVKRLKVLLPAQKVLGLWVNGKWQV